MPKGVYVRRPRPLQPRPLIDNGDGTHTIPLTRGLSSVIDSTDADFAGRFNWCALLTSGKFYAKRRRPDGTTELLHVALAGEPGLEVDHVDGDGLNNRRCNLRPATSSQNKHNRGKGRNNTSGFKGVWWHKQHGRWAADIWLHSKKRFLGLFDTAELAHAAYCKAAAELHGEFARTE
jgi:hypothetical protein